MAKKPLSFIRSHSSSLVKKEKEKAAACDDAATVCADSEELEVEEEERAQILAVASVFPPNCHKQVRTRRGARGGRQHPMSSAKTADR